MNEIDGMLHFRTLQNSSEKDTAQLDEVVGALLLRKFYVTPDHGVFVGEPYWQTYFGPELRYGREQEDLREFSLPIAMESGRLSGLVNPFEERNNFLWSLSGARRHGLTVLHQPSRPRLPDEPDPPPYAHNDPAPRYSESPLLPSFRLSQYLPENSPLPQVENSTSPIVPPKLAAEEPQKYWEGYGEDQYPETPFPSPNGRAGQNGYRQRGPLIRNSSLRDRLEK